MIRGLALAAAAALVLSGCAGGTTPATPSPSPTPSPTPTPTPAAITVKGTFTVNDAFIADMGNDWEYSLCQLEEGYSDIRSGAQVKVLDASGTTLALSALGDGKAVGVEELNGDQWASGCQFEFLVPGVPPTENIYGVEVSHRGVVQFPRSALSSPLKLTLG